MQIDKEIKWANCCREKTGCIYCGKFESCKRWFAYVDKHRGRKGYAHFDRRTSLADESTRMKVMDDQWVTHHGFWPLIHAPMKWDKFKENKETHKLERIKKVRDVRYPAHMDRCVFQRYAFLINEQYDDLVRGTDVDRCAIAYRTDKGLSTIDYAKSVFDFITQYDDCIVLVIDFKDFFESLDHKLLKSSLSELLQCDVLPPDYYAVFKNSTRYSCWDWESLLEINHFENSRGARKKLNSKELVLTREEFLQYRKSCVRKNGDGMGVPQGSPISAVLSNVYLFDLDTVISKKVLDANGLYYRYCDDVIVVLPAETDGLEKPILVIEEIVRLLDTYQGLTVQPEKTALLRYTRCDGLGRISQIDDMGKFKGEAKLDYLGFSFDGNNVRIREKTIGKYYYRMRGKARSAAKQGRGTEQLYGRYSEKSNDINGKSSFVDYAKRANAAINMNDPASQSIVNHNMEKIAKAFNEFSRDDNS